MKKDENSKKSILKKSNGDISKSGVTWDEQNILETFHPVGKDYGHMKIDEPPTPFESDFESDSSSVSNKKHKRHNSNEKAKHISFEPLKNNEEKNLNENNEKDKLKHKKFEDARKKHYDEYTKVKLARKLMEKDLLDMDLDLDLDSQLEK